MAEWYTEVAGVLGIAITIIGGGYFAVQKSRVDNGGPTPAKKPTATDELHAIVEVLQNELRETAKRHADEIKYLQARLDDVSTAYDKSVDNHRKLEARFSKAIKEVKRLMALLKKNRIPIGRSYLEDIDLE